MVRMEVNLAELPHLIRWVELRHLSELCMLDLGTKAVVRMPLEGPLEFAVVERFARERGLTLVRSRMKTVVEFRNQQGEEFVTWVEDSDPRPGANVGYIARQPAHAEEAEAAEREGDNELLGAQLGYPACCSRSYERIQSNGNWLDLLLERLPERAALWGANRIAYALYGASTFPDYFPCRLTCRETQSLSDEGERALRVSGFAPLADRFVLEMRLPLVVTDTQVHGVPPHLAESPDDVLLRASSEVWPSLQYRQADPNARPQGQACIVRFA